MTRLSGASPMRSDMRASVRAVQPRDWLIAGGLWLIALAVYTRNYLSAPPGISGDAARLGIYAWDLLQERLLPFYIYHQFAPNPAVVYLQAPVFALLGYTRTALRGVTVVGATLAVPAIYLAARWLFESDDTRFARRAGVLAGVELALSSLFSLYSRYGIEGAWLPVVELATVAFLWRGIRRNSWPSFALAGICLGLSQYVYIVARFFPVALAVGVAVAILANRRLAAHWRGFLLTAFCAAAVALPQWVLFARAPYTFSARTQQAAGAFVMDLANPLPILAAKLQHQILMLGWRWENHYAPYSLQPLLTPVLAIGLVIAVGVTLARRRDSYLFALALMVMMLLPDLLAYEGMWPVMTRVVPALPFVVLVAALGAATLWAWLDAKPRVPRWVGYAIPLLVVSAGIVRLWDTSHRVIPLVNASDGLEWRASLAEVAEADYIAAHADAPILLPSSEYQRAPLAFLLATRYPRRAGAQQAPLAAGEAITIIQPTAPDRPTTEGIPAGYRPDEWVLLKDGVAHFLPPAADSFEPASGRRTPIVAENGVTVAEAVPAHWKGGSSNYVPLRASFADGLDLVGYQVGDLTPGRELPVSLLWRPRAKITGDAEMFVQLLDRNRQAVAGVHTWPLHGAYRVRAWRPGETVPVSASLAVPADLAPGAYELIAGVYDLLHRRPVTTASGDGQQLVTRLKVPLPPDDRTPQVLQTARFGDSIALTGHTLSPAEGGLSLTLFWEATGAPPADYTAFVHVVDANGRIIAQSDGEPLQGSYPTSIWGPGERVVEQRTIAAPPGTYQVYTGWYRTDTQERLPVASGAGADSENRLALGAITVP